MRWAVASIIVLALLVGCLFWRVHSLEQERANEKVREQRVREIREAVERVEDILRSFQVASDSGKPIDGG